MRLPRVIGSHVQVFLAGGPVFMILYEHGSQQADGGGSIGKDANDPLAPPDFFIEPFLAVGGAQSRPIGSRQGQDSGDVVKRPVEFRTGAWSGGGIGAEELLFEQHSSGSIGSMQHRMQSGMHLRLQVFGGAPCG